MHVYAVREVTTYLRELFDSNPHLGDLWIAGEVSNVSRPASGHVYFTLKDGDAQLKSVFFLRRGAPSANTSRLIENGQAIVVHGRISLYEQRGELQLYADFVQPEGVGALQAEYERLKARLEQEGLFEPSRKRELPRFPGSIGVVTSPTGAVFHDICHVLERRWPLARVVLSPAPVQGPDAVAAIVGAIDQLNRRDDIDVIIVGRGGGSLEELWAFNHESVARAIFASSVPIVSAVGHETDYTIADFVADRRAPTPSAAAEIVAPDLQDAIIRLGIAAGAMESTVRDELATRRTRAMQLLRTVEHLAPRFERERQRVDDATRRATHAAEQAHRPLTAGVGNCVWRLKSLDPFATLDRGYAIVQRGREVISTVAAPRRGEALQVRVKDGSFGVHVAGAASPRHRSRRTTPDAQAPLFTMPEERA